MNISEINRLLQEANDLIRLCRDDITTEDKATHSESIAVSGLAISLDALRLHSKSCFYQAQEIQDAEIEHEVTA